MGGRRSEGRTWDFQEPGEIIKIIASLHNIMQYKKYKDVEGSTSERGSRLHFRHSV